MFSNPFFFENAFNVVKDIGDFYNDPDTRGALQPLLVGHDSILTNTLPEWTANEYRFDLQENTVYDGLIQVVDRMGSSVAAGGGGDFWELGFVDTGTLGIDLETNLFISGNPPSQQDVNGKFDPDKAVTITDSLAVNPGDEEGGIEATRGTVVGSWGDIGFGSLPVAVQQFSGANEAFRLIQEYNDALVYPIDSLVNIDTKNADGDQSTFSAIQEVPINTEPPNATFWEEITFQLFLLRFDVPLEYSPWTNFRTTAWRVSGAKPSGFPADENPLFADSLAVWDSNLVIVDTDALRTFADFRGISTASVPSEYKYSGTDLYRGFRILVDTINLGALGVPFNQNNGRDANGVAFNNNLVQHNGGQFTGAEEWKNWDVFRVIEDLNMIAVDDEAGVFQRIAGFVDLSSLPAWAPGVFYNPVDRVQDLGVGYQCVAFNLSTNLTPPRFTLTCATLTQFWKVLPSSDELQVLFESPELFNDCYHIPSTIANDPNGGFFQKPNNGGTTTFGDDSAIRYTYKFSKDDYFQFIQCLGNKAKYYRVGAWANFKFPFPHNAFQGDIIGEEYGNNPDRREPVTVNTSNMHFTHSGKIGFNNLEAEDLGGLTSIVTAQKFRYKADFDDDDNQIIAYGNIPCRCVCYDLSDNVVVQDFTIPFNNQWTQVVLPLDGFQNYRARTPAKFASVFKAFVKRVEVLNVFRWRDLKKIGFQWLRTYDEQGRFDPALQDALGDLILQDGFRLTDDVRVDWSFDQIYFGKSNLVVTAPDTDRALMPLFADMPLVSNHISQKQATDAMLEITGFRHKQFDITTEGTFDINFADSFFLENSQLVNEADKPDNGGFVPNTIKLVAKKIVYTIDKQPQGAGGFLKTITGVKRIE